MKKRYTLNRPSCTLIVAGKAYVHGDDITELAPKYWEKYGREVPTEAKKGDEEE